MATVIFKPILKILISKNNVGYCYPLIKIANIIYNKSEQVIFNPYSDIDIPSD